MHIKHINPAALYDGAPFGMSQATVDAARGLVFVSGQVDWDTDYQVKHGSIEAQAESALQNLLTVLAEAGSSADNVLQLRIYVRGELADHMDALAPLMSKYFGASRPALTGIGVASLASRETLIEIEAVARVCDE
ncbi:MAG TPA: RidA family protein [Telluria sp.]|jgi:enamine deaminase RidA (YjgF/YER057c/UK114 family)